MSVERIGEMYRRGVAVDDIARQFGVSPGYIYVLASQHNWPRTRVKRGQRAGPRIARAYVPPPPREYRPPPMVRPGGESFRDDRTQFTVPET